MLNDELYVSVDIEANGPIPGPYSMLSLGAAAFSISKTTYEAKLIDTFSVNLQLLEGAKVNQETEKWWNSSDKNKAAYAATRIDTKGPNLAMHEFVEWVNKLAAETNVKPVFVAYPAGYDWIWTYWYMINFGCESPFSFSALDIKTASMWSMKCGYRSATKRNMPKHWFSKSKHTHVAIDDAIEQGELFCNMLAENMKR